MNSLLVSRRDGGRRDRGSTGALRYAGSMTTNVPTIDLNSGTSIPQLGLGVWQASNEETEQAVRSAIDDAGYRHIDTAAAYGNEELVGLGIKDGLEKTGLVREDIWVTSKLWNDHHDPNRVEEALDTSLHKLGVGYLDLYHMHWPVASTTSWVPRSPTSPS